MSDTSIVVLSGLSLCLSVVLFLVVSCGVKLLRECAETVNGLHKDIKKNKEDIDSLIQAHNTLVVALYGNIEDSSSELSDSQKNDTKYSRRN